MTENWAKSSYCNTVANCVETRTVDGKVGISDSKFDERPVIGVRAEAWQAFVSGIDGVR